MPGNKIEWIRYGAETGSFMAVGNQPAPQLLRHGFQHSTTYTQLDNFLNVTFTEGTTPISGIQIQSTISSSFRGSGRVIYLNTEGTWEQADCATTAVWQMLGISPIIGQTFDPIFNQNLLIQGWAVLKMAIVDIISDESIYIDNPANLCQGIPLYLGGRNAGDTAGMLINKPPSTIDARNKDRKIANLVEYNQDTRRGLVWFDPSLCLPNIAPEGEETIYYGGSGTGNEGCRTGTQGTQYTLYLFAGVFYTDPGLTTPFDGGDLWYYDPITNTSYQINSSGVVIDSFPC
jgi:hypothetical protein